MRAPLHSAAALACSVLAAAAALPQPGPEAPLLEPTKEMRASVEERQATLRNVVVIDSGEPQWRGERISLSTKDADLVELLRAFAKLAGVNLVVDPSVNGKVTLELHDVPWDQALHVILRSHGLGAELDGRIWGVQPAGGGP